MRLSLKLSDNLLSKEAQQKHDSQVRLTLSSTARLMLLCCWIS